MEILVKFTPEEFQEYQEVMKNKTKYRRIIDQRDEVVAKFEKLQDAIEDAGFGITIHCGGGRDKYTIHEMDDELKAYYKEHPHSTGYIRPYQD